MERMPVLEELIASGGSKEDLVVLHINHCMDNSFYFNRQLEKTGARVIFVAAPYNVRRAGCEGEEVCYRAAEMENGFRIVRFQRGTDGHESWEKCLPETEFAGAVRAMIDEALKRDVLPLVKEGKRWLLLEDGGYHYPVLNAFFEEYPDMKRTFLGCVEQTMSGTRNALAASPDYPVLSAAGQAARGHRKTDLMDPGEYPADLVIRGERICLPLIAGLIRLADELDLCCERSGLLGRAGRAVNDPYSRLVWRTHGTVKRLDIQAEEFVIVEEGADEETHRELQKWAGKLQAVSDEVWMAVEQRTAFFLPKRGVRIMREPGLPV